MGNQYFQLVYRDDKAFLHIFPATGEGKKLEIGEVTSYLDSRKYSNYNLKELHTALQSEDAEMEVFVGPWDGIVASESMDLNITLDKMNVICRFYPAAPGGRQMDAREIVGSLTFHKIKFGLNQQAIFDFLQDRQYCTDYIFARGQEPVQGRDAKIEYFFNTDTNLQPKRNEDGSVDYKELNTISHVRQGELLARLIKEDPGKPGKNVFGEELHPRAVKSAVLSFGNHISCNEDKTEIYSDVTGHANFLNGKVFVSNVYEVAADVDNSVGNIAYDGSVLIHGNVKTGFSVKASGDVIIEGVVEGAQIEAGGQIVVKHGIHGMFKGVFHAGTNLMAKYIESATVYAGGYVEAEIILNSEVSALFNVRVHGKKGLINGGTVRAGECVEADNIGTAMGTATAIEVGVEPEKKERYAELVKEIGQQEQEMEDTNVILSNYTSRLKKGDKLPQDKLLYVQKLAGTYREMQTRVEKLREEKNRIHEDMMKSDHASVVVTRSIYPGVSLAISDLTYQIKDERSYCKYKKQDGEIHCVGL